MFVRSTSMQFFQFEIVQSTSMQYVVQDIKFFQN